MIMPSQFARVTIIGIVAFATACGGNHSSSTGNENSTVDTMTNKTSSVTQQNYGNTDGSEIIQYTLSNTAGMVVKIINYGGTITNVMVPDSVGNFGDVVL